jgi:hypothetical protein
VAPHLTTSDFILTTGPPFLLAPDPADVTKRYYSISLAALASPRRWPGRRWRPGHIHATAPARRQTPPSRVLLLSETRAQPLRLVSEAPLATHIGWMQAVVILERIV